MRVQLKSSSASLYLLDAFDDIKQGSGLRSSHNLWNKTTSPSDISRLQRPTKFQHSVLHGKLVLLGHSTAQDITVASADEQLLNSPLIFSNKPRISSSVLLLTFEYLKPALTQDPKFPLSSLHRLDAQFTNRLTSNTVKTRSERSFIAVVLVNRSVVRATVKCILLPIIAEKKLPFALESADASIRFISLNPKCNVNANLASLIVVMHSSSVLAFVVLQGRALCLPVFSNLSNCLLISSHLHFCFFF